MVPDLHIVNLALKVANTSATNFIVASDVKICCCFDRPCRDSARDCAIYID
jgi:hypothetical protein